MIYKETPEFRKDVIRLLKRFRTLESDLEKAKTNAIELFHERRLNNRSIFEMPRYPHNRVIIFKLKKFACMALKGKGVKSGIRIIYSFRASDNSVEFIEMYYKGDKANEDGERIMRYLTCV